MSLHPWLVPIWTRYVNYKGHTQHSIDDAIAYLGRRRAGGQERPLFVFLNLMGTHFPYRPPQDYVERIAPDITGDRLAYAFMRRFNADAARWASPPDPSLTEWERQALDGFYDAEIAYQDDHLGRLLDYLRESGALRDTLVIIAADHGEGHGDHDFVGHGFVVYQELVHVPLIVHFPERFPKSARISTTVSTRRIFHTVLDIVGIKPPLDETDPNANVAGLSLVNATDGARDTEGNLAFAEAFPPTTFLGVLERRNPAIIERLSLTQVRRGIYDGANKLAVVGGRVEGLFDVSADPAETRDLSVSKPDLAADLHRKLDLFVNTAEKYRAGGAAFSQVTEKVVDQLRALGYIE
jgi:uncharacterized sulfatase